MNGKEVRSILSKLRSELADLGSSQTARESGYAEIAAEAVRSLEQTLIGWDQTREALDSADAKAFSDAASRAKAEHGLAVSQDLINQQLAEIESLYQTAPVGLCYVDRDWRYVRINQLLADMHGLSVEAHIGCTIESVVPERWPIIKRRLDQVIDTGKPIFGLEVQGPCLTDPSRLCTWHVSHHPIVDHRGQIVGINVAALDITKQKEDEAARLAVEARFRATFGSAGIGIALIDVANERRIVESNRKFSEIFGRSPEELCGVKFESLAQPGDAEEIRELCDSVGRRPDYSFQVERRYRRSDGGGLWGRTTASLIRSEGDQSHDAYVIVMIDDVSDQKFAESALKESEHRFRQAVIAAPNPVMIHTQDGQVLNLSQAWTQITGYRIGDIPTIESWARQAYGSDASAIINYVQQTYEQQLPKTDLTETTITTKQGEQRIWMLSSAPLGRLTDGRRVRITSAMDVTERRRAQQRAQDHLEQAAHMSRLNMLGEMAAGLAHELNQPLAAIANYTQGSLRQLQAEGPIDRDRVVQGLSRAVAQADRAAKIISRIRALIQKHEPVRANIDLNQLIREALVIAQADMREHDVTVKLELDQSLPSLLADGIQIEQVVLNLLRNAVEALEQVQTGVPSIIIQTQMVDSERIRMTVTDNGEGISDESLDYIFHPFYTTKDEGMGIGLNICQSIVETHGGRLWAERNPAGGTRVLMELPLNES